jgi:signal transduction histidine kinase
VERQRPSGSPTSRCSRRASPQQEPLVDQGVCAAPAATPSDEQFIENFGRTVTHQVERIERLLDRLRTLARPGERPQHPIDLRAPIGAAIEAMRPAFVEKSVVLSAATGKAPCMILGDYSELEQLFLNLLLNAHEATSSGGMARVEVVVSAGRYRRRRGPGSRSST